VVPADTVANVTAQADPVPPQDVPITSMYFPGIVMGVHAAAPAVNAAGIGLVFLTAGGFSGMAASVIAGGPGLLLLPPLLLTGHQGR
jgi:hypothetical protein